MKELLFYFSPIQLAAFGLWAVFSVWAMRARRIGEPLYLLCLTTVTANAGYLCLIFFDILGAGFEKGAILPRFDAFIDVFPFVFIGLPMLMVAIAGLMMMESWRLKTIRPLSVFYAALSIYLLSAVWLVHVDVISSI